MSNEKIARELVKIAKELTSKKSPLEQLKDAHFKSRMRDQIRQLDYRSNELSNALSKGSVGNSERAIAESAKKLLKKVVERAGKYEEFLDTLIEETKGLERNQKL